MVKVIFYGTEKSKSSTHELTVTSTFDNEILIEIDEKSEHGLSFGSICLDKQTAIKFHRELKKQISFLTENA